MAVKDTRKNRDPRLVEFDRKKEYPEFRRKLEKRGWERGWTDLEIDMHDPYLNKGTSLKDELFTILRGTNSSGTILPYDEGIIQIVNLDGEEKLGHFYGAALMKLGELGKHYDANDVLDSVDLAVDRGARREKIAENARIANENMHRKLNYGGMSDEEIAVRDARREAINRRITKAINSNKPLFGDSGLLNGKRALDL